ncbi:hypothetical protein [Chitinimonas naiadis]
MRAYIVIAPAAALCLPAVFAVGPDGVPSIPVVRPLGGKALAGGFTAGALYYACQHGAQ